MKLTNFPEHYAAAVKSLVDPPIVITQDLREDVGYALEEILINRAYAIEVFDPIWVAEHITPLDRQLLANRDHINTMLGVDVAAFLA